MATKRTSTPKPTTESPERQRLRAAAVARSRATLAAWGVPTRAATPTALAADGGDLPRTNDWAMLADGRGVGFAGRVALGAEGVLAGAGTFDCAL